MKKVLSILLVAGIATFVACGPSAEEKAAMDKARQDSIATVQKAYDDSVASANAAAAEKAKQDSLANANMEKARQDSIEAASKKDLQKQKRQKRQLSQDNLFQAVRVL